MKNVSKSIIYSDIQEYFDTNRAHIMCCLLVDKDIFINDHLYENTHYTIENGCIFVLLQEQIDEGILLDLNQKQNLYLYGIKLSNAFHDMHYNNIQKRILKIYT